VDKAGNKSKETKLKAADKTPPSAPAVNKVTSKSKKVPGKADKGAAIRIYRDSKLIGKSAVSAKGTFSDRKNEEFLQIEQPQMDVPKVENREWNNPHGMEDEKEISFLPGLWDYDFLRYKSKLLYPAPRIFFIS